MTLPEDFLPNPDDAGNAGRLLQDPIPLHPPPASAEPTPAWTGWDVLAVLCFTVFLVIAFGAVALILAHQLPAYHGRPISDLTTNAWVVIGSQAAAYPLILLFMFFVVRSRSHAGFAESVQWRWPGSSGMTFFVLGIFLAVATEGLAHFLPIPRSLPIDKYFTSPSSAYLMAAFGLTLAPLLEEFFFRGMLYPVLRKWFGLGWGVVLTAAAFAAIHGTQLGYAWAPVLGIFVVGLALTVTRVRTNSVASSFLMHCGYNFTLFAMLWLASDHFRHLEKVTS